MFKSFFAREATPAKPVLTTSVALQNDLWVIHPPADGDAALPTSMGEDTMVRGVASFVSEPNALLWDVRIALVVQYSYRLPGTSRWEQAIVYEQGQTFKHDDPEDPVQVFSMNDGKEIKRQIEFGMLLPRSLATYEHLPNAKIIPQIRVTAEFSKNTWSAAALAALPRSPPVYVDSEESKEIAGRRFISESWRGGSVLIDREGPEKSVDSTSLLPPSSSHLSQTWIKNFALAANPDPTAGPRKLRLQKRDVQEGLGEYTLSVWSDSFSVGSYFIPRIDFRDVSPHCNIYSIQLSLVQSYSVVPFEEFMSGHSDPEDHQYPSETFLLHAEGNKPGTNRPGKEEPTLWRGPANRRGTGRTGSAGETTNSHRWQAKRVRIPDDSTIRPTTLAGTKSPIRVKHKLVLKVYFSVAGETLSGEPLHGEPEGSGDLRMLMVNLPELLPSCCCIAEWVHLPGYEESMRKQGDSDIPVCACCYAMQDFPSCSFEEAFPPQSITTSEHDSVHSTPSTLSKTPASDSRGGR